jgi:simple sugar transport system permease protein
MVDQVVNIITSGIVFSVPILLAAIGETFSERAGIIVLAVEGEILAGAFTSFIVVNTTGNYFLGLMAGICAGVLIALIHAFGTVTLRVDQIVSGIGLNMVVLAATSFFFRQIFWTGELTFLPHIQVLDKLPIPLLWQIPVLGPILFNHNFLTYTALLLVPIASFVIFRTNYGLAIRAAGEDPNAADAAGIKVILAKYLSVLIGGALAGLGGVVLALGQSGVFMDGMSAGRGFLAVSAVIFGNWNPWGVLIGALLFGLLESLQVFLQAIGSPIPYQFMQMLPYIVCVLALAVATRKARIPAALGIPFHR